MWSESTNEIIKILTDDNLKHNMGENGRKLIQQKYEWSEIAKSIYELYEELL